ncbi:MAG: ZIP family metal transporter [Rhizobiaceae bacterium]
MNEIWIVLLLALLPGAGNFAGGLLAEFWKSSPRLLNWALHSASGIVVAIAAVELIPEATRTLPALWFAGAFAAGGAAYLLLQGLIERLQTRSGGDNDRVSMWMVYVAVATDLASDGLMIGTGAAISAKFALVLAAGQLLADIPEGYATIANLRKRAVPRPRRLLLSVSFLAYVLVAAATAYLVLRPAPEALKSGALVFVASLLIVAAVEDMLEEAHRARKDTRSSIAAFVSGFVLFTLVSSGLKAAI